MLQSECDSTRRKSVFYQHVRETHGNVNPPIGLEIKCPGLNALETLRCDKQSKRYGSGRTNQFSMAKKSGQMIQGKGRTKLRTNEELTSEIFDVRNLLHYCIINCIGFKLNGIILWIRLDKSKESLRKNKNKALLLCTREHNGS